MHLGETPGTRGRRLGRLKPGEPMPERLLAEQLGVSRTPVREALFTLQSEGLVELTPNRGATVRMVTAQDIVRIYSLRGVLESYAAREAATTREQHHQPLRARALHRRGARRAGLRGPAQREVAARESHGSEGRIRVASFPAAHLGTLDFLTAERRVAARPVRHRQELPGHRPEDPGLPGQAPGAVRRRHRVGHLAGKAHQGGRLHDELR